MHRDHYFNSRMDLNQGRLILFMQKIDLATKKKDQSQGCYTIYITTEQNSNVEVEYPCTSSERNQRYPSVKSYCLANFSATTKSCENCAWQVVLLQYTSHYFSHCNSDQWSSRGTFPAIITTILHKETALPAVLNEFVATKTEKPVQSVERTIFT